MKMFSFLLLMLFFNTNIMRAQLSTINPTFSGLFIPYDTPETILDYLSKNGVELEFENKHYHQIEVNNNNYLVIKNERSKLRAFKILKETNQLFVLCLQKKDICKCNANTFLLVKSTNQLQKIERPFSFSMRRDLLKRLDKLQIEKPANIKGLAFCEILKEL